MKIYQYRIIGNKKKPAEIFNTSKLSNFYKTIETFPLVMKNTECI